MAVDASKFCRLRCALYTPYGIDGGSEVFKLSSVQRAEFMLCHDMLFDRLH